MWVAIDFTYGIWSKVEGLDSLLKKPRCFAAAIGFAELTAAPWAGGSFAQLC